MQQVGVFEMLPTVDFYLFSYYNIIHNIYRKRFGLKHEHYHSRHQYELAVCSETDWSRQKTIVLRSST